MTRSGRASAPRETRQAAWRRGRRAERLAAWWLRLKGYHILARGFRVGAGEIDLVARRGRVLALVEVKARDSMAQALDAVGPTQRARIARAAAAFLQRHPELAGLDVRYDAVLISPGRWPRHVTDAWR